MHVRVTNALKDAILSQHYASTLINVVLPPSVQDFGATWLLQSSAPTDGVWSSIASSDSGEYLVAVSYGGGVYTSDVSFNLPASFVIVIFVICNQNWALSEFDSSLL